MSSQSVSAILKAKLEKIQAYQDFDLEGKELELGNAKEALKRAKTKVSDLVTEITDYKLTVGLPVEETSTMGVLSNDDLVAKLAEVMPRFPNGANGKEIADAIGIYGVGSDDISALYWMPGQTTLKKTGKGMQTKYFLAAEGDLEAINKAKDAELAGKAKAKA